jgi:DNA gyrase subunit A
MDPSATVALSTEAERLYLNYALSVITARALPDVRDGLKPVQRRILYAMWSQLRLGPDAKPMKCARIVGDVMGKLHPHGDSAIYEALVRMAQSWTLRGPLVFGQGNFGSIDGDAPAAMRYTEARLEKLAVELIEEITQRTVPFRPNYDGTSSEPVVLPARFPNLLVNGAQGIAVGMATSIPPHNLGEVIDGLVELIEKPETSVKQLVTKIKGPDFPTGGELLDAREALIKVYETGQGSVGVRGEYKVEDDKRSRRIIVTSIPYGVEKHAIVEKIADVIESKKLPQLVDVRDESTDVIRVVLEIKRDAAPELVMAYLFKHTPLQTSVQVNLTCLVPTDNEQVGAPRRLDLKEMLRHFLDFRLEVTQKRLRHQLSELERRLHILEGFGKVFDALDEIIKIIRRSEGKQDAADKIMKRFGLDDEQTDAILELKLYRLARLEILVIQKEADEKRLEAKKLQTLLKSEAKLWALIKDELVDLKKTYADKRRTRIARGGADEPEFKAEDFIVDQDAYVLITAQGWLRRQGSVKDLSATRMRDGDRLLACLGGSSRATVVFFSSQGTAYTTRIDDVPPSTGYGDPIQKLFKLDDGERIVAAASLDPRLLEVPPPTEGKEPEPPYAVAVTRLGSTFRFSLRGFRDPSTRAGRRFARLAEGDELVAVLVGAGHTHLVAASSAGTALGLPLDELPVLSGPGKGVALMKLPDGAEILGAQTGASAKATKLVAYTEKDTRYEVSAHDVRGERAARGTELVKRGGFARVEPPTITVPTLPERTGDK